MAAGSVGGLHPAIARGAPGWCGGSPPPTGAPRPPRREGSARWRSRLPAPGGPGGGERPDQQASPGLIAILRGGAATARRWLAALCRVPLGDRGAGAGRRTWPPEDAIEGERAQPPADGADHFPARHLRYG